METAVRKGAYFTMSTEDKKNYTVDDIYALPDGVRAELFDGEMVMMASPSTVHQELLVSLSVQIYNFLRAERVNAKYFLHLLR